MTGKAKNRSVLVGIAMAYYGLCRTADIMKIHTQDFHRLVDEDGHTYYTFIYKPPTYTDDDPDTDMVGLQQSKDRQKTNKSKPFQFDLPTWLTVHIDEMIRLTTEA